ETEVWSMFIDPIIDGLLSDPEENYHVRWTKTKDNNNDQERPDSVVCKMVESTWAHSVGCGECKVAEVNNNLYILAWDLCRLGYFNKHSINENMIRKAVAFHIYVSLNVGHGVTFYVTELAYDGLYTMTEICHIQVPKSLTTMDTLVSRRSLVSLLQIVHVFNQVKEEQTVASKKCSSMKRDGPSLKWLKSFASDKKDRRRESSISF
ncbi:hypothetical protein F4703DRAFT_1734696, partial [Phycomyces blakesleeanus]